MFWDNDKNWERKEIALKWKKENGLLFTTFYGTYEHNILEVVYSIAANNPYDK